MNHTLSKEDYYSYNYHSNMIQIYQNWLNQNTTINAQNVSHRKIITLLHHSLHIKDAVDVMWRQQQKSEDNQTLLERIQTHMESIKKYYQGAKNIVEFDIEIFEKHPFMKSFLASQKQVVEVQAHEHHEINEETTNKYLTWINAERVYLGVVRNFFSYLLRNSWYFDAVRQLNIFSLLLANYLYIIRLHLKLYVMFTIEKSKEFEELSYLERVYGYLIASQRQLLNDFFWSVVLFSISFHIYFKNAQMNKFFSQETTGLGINLFIGFALLFDVWNSWRAVEELDKNWQAFIDENPELENELTKNYIKIRREKLALFYYCTAICGINILSGMFDVIDFMAKNRQLGLSESLAHIIPFINIALIGLMFVAQIIYLTRDYWDKDFQNLPSHEKNKIKIKAMNQAIEEALKVLIIAIVIFVIASQIPFGGIPQMLILALLTISMIAFVKVIKDYLEPKIIEQFNSPQDDPLPAAT